MAVSPADEKLFDLACREIVQNKRERAGIGTLQEKTVHAVLKRFYEPDSGHQEIRVGNCVADIFRDGEIIEIQTRHFDALKKKLSLFLPQYPVTIVYPIAHTKWLYWVDEKTGELSDKRKSPRTGTPYDIFYELYKIKKYLTHPNLSLCLVLMDVEEYRLLNGWSRDKKRGSTRYDRIPVKLTDEIFIGDVGAYGCLIPEGLSEPFTSKDFALAAKIRRDLAQRGLTILNDIGAVERTGKAGNSYLYVRNL